MSNKDTGPYWFARRDGAVRGPLEVDHLKRCILLGRIRVDDELSRDEYLWRPVTDFPELLPGGVEVEAAGPEDYQRLLAAHSEADERVGERRHTSARLPSTVRTDRRKMPDRRNGNWLSFVAQLYRLSPEKSRQVPSVRVLLLTTLIAGLVLAYFSAFSR